MASTTTGEATGMNTIMRTIGGAFGAQLAAVIVAEHVTAGSAFLSEAGFTSAFVIGVSRWASRSRPPRASPGGAAPRPRASPGSRQRRAAAPEPAVPARPTRRLSDVAVSPWATIEMPTSTTTLQNTLTASVSASTRPSMIAAA
jgi:hypothetical protein